MFLDIDWDRRFFFSFISLLVGLPTGNKVFGWLYALHSFGPVGVTEVPVYFVLLFISMFSFGGFTGLVLGCVGLDYFFHDTYYVVAHFHYVMSVAVSLGSTVGYSVFQPRLRRVNTCKPSSIANNIILVLFSNLTFIPLHFLGFYSIPRRYAVYAIGLSSSNFASSMGATLNVLATLNLL